MTFSRRLAFLIVIGAGGLAVLIGLGTWQMQRLAWKEAMIADLESRLAQAPLELTGSETEEADAFRRASAVGRYVDATPARFLTSMKPTGPGFRIIQPFELSNGARILVDRGYAPEAQDPGPPPETAMSLTGALHWPNEISAFTPDPNLETRLWFARDVPSLSAAFDTEQVMLVLDAPDHDATWPKPLAVSVDLPNDHLGYAITWFSLAVVWLVMSVILMRRA